MTVETHMHWYVGRNTAQLRLARVRMVGFYKGACRLSLACCYIRRRPGGMIAIRFRAGDKGEHLSNDFWWNTDGSDEMEHCWRRTQTEAERRFQVHLATAALTGDARGLTFGITSHFICPNCPTETRQRRRAQEQKVHDFCTSSKTLCTCEDCRRKRTTDELRFG